MRFKGIPVKRYGVRDPTFYRRQSLARRRPSAASTIQRAIRRRLFKKRLNAAIQQRRLINSIVNQRLGYMPHVAQRIAGFAGKPNRGYSWRSYRELPGTSVATYKPGTSGDGRP